MKKLDARQARTNCLDRARQRCEAQLPGCDVRAVHAHHVILRSRGGTNDPENLLAVCHRCHMEIHAHPAKATELGLMRSAWS